MPKRRESISAEVERLERELAELRALRQRVERKRLGDGDCAVLGALISEVIEQAEPGQEWVTIEVPEEGEASVGQTSEAVGVENSTFERPRK